MTKIAKFLKGSMGPVIVIILLLFAQAMGDLSLPSYTSDIVNVGIQQGGVKEIAPDAILESGMNHIMLFMSEEDKKVVLDNYELKDKNQISDEEYKTLVREYASIEKEPIYVIKKEANIENLNAIMAKPLLIVLSMSTDNEKTSAMKQQMLATMPMPEGTNPEEVDLLTLFSQMDQATLVPITQQIISQFDSMDEYLVNQSAIAGTTAQLKAVGVDMDALQTNYILWAGAKMIGMAILIMLAAIMVTLLSARVAAKVSMNLRNQLFSKVVSFSNTEMDQFSTASLITRSTNDIQQVQMLIAMLLRMVIYSPILGIGGIIKVVQTNTEMVWIIGLAIGLILIVVITLLIVAMPKFNRMQKLVDRLNLVTREILTGLPVIRAFSTEKHEAKRFDGANRDLTRNMLFTNRVMTFMMPTMMLIMNGIMVLIVWVGGKNVDTGVIQVGDMMAFIQYTMQIVMSFLMLTMVSIIFPRAAVSAKRIDEVLTTENHIVDLKQPKQLGTTKGVVRFDHVSFRYPNADEDALEDIDFVAQPGQTTAIIGSTGCGKTTLVNLIPRLYDVTKGKITIDGMDIREITQHELREKIGFVPQKGILFSGTIASNIAYGCEDVREKQVEKAATIAQAKEFIEGKKSRYDSEISQGGSNVSGGQKQRLSIARAIAKDPQIYVFDDSFSALDYKTDVTLRKALQDETGDSTVIIVAQRISTILHADQILVLDEGKIVGKGTHRELLNSSDVYRQIALSQLSEEEIKKDLDQEQVESKEVKNHE